MNGRVLMAAAACAWLCGCSDAGMIVAPSPEVTLPERDAPSRSASVNAPNFGSATEVPVEYRYPEIRRATATASWDGSTARVYGMAISLSNRLEMALSMTVTKGSSQVIHQTQTFREESFFPGELIMGRSMQFTVESNCGHMVNGANLVTASNVVLINWGPMNLGTSNREAYDADGQPICKQLGQSGPPATPPGGGGGDDPGGGIQRCVTVVVERYELEVETGMIYYRGSTTETECFLIA
jgi:hypothetical protein